METINSQIKENILFRIIENAIKGDEKKLFSYANKFRKEFIDNPMFDEDTFRKLIHNYLHPEDGNWTTMDYKNKKRIDEYERKRERVDSFENLKRNWDGRGALNISTNAIKNAHEIIFLFEEFELDISKWSFNPGVNGEVLIDYRGDNALSSFYIYDRDFSYFIEHGDSYIKGNAETPFNAYEVFSWMRYVEDKNAAK